MIRHTSADEQAIDYLKDKPVGSILTNEANGYLPLFWKKGSVGYANGKVIEPAIASQYTYLLLVEKQSGWVPDSTYIGIYKNMNDLPFKQIATFSSESRTAILFKNTLP
jgi:hypothetical protein